jgi:hypothetical protein
MQQHGCPTEVESRTDDDTSLEQQLFNITQAELEREVSPYRVADDHRPGTGGRDNAILSSSSTDLTRPRR